MKAFLVCVLALATGTFAKIKCPLGQNINGWDSKDLLYPHEDCEKYYICVHGEPVEQICPIGLLYNDKRKQCDWSENVRCKQKSLKEEITETVAKIAEPSTVYADLANTKCHIVDLLNWKKDVLLPHWDCDKYYQCADGVAVPRPCPEKLHFNFVTDTCDYPENVKCYRGSNADVEPSVVDVPSVSAVLAEHKCRVFEILGVQRDVLFAHWDCDKYYICDNGAAVTLPCPAGLHFNSFTDTCDYPHNVICFRSSSVEKGAETIAKIAGPSTVYTDLANTKCHIVDLLNWKKDVLLPHWDCDKFYQCADGVAVPRPCPEKLHFNFVTDTCDYPENVKCYRGSNADVEPSVVDVPSVSAVLAEHKCRVFEILGVQRDVLFAHWDCDKYYICDNGAAVTLPCPAGLHFNSFTDTCDYPHNVICFRSSSVEKGAETIAKIAAPSTVYTDLANTKCHIVDLLNWKKDVLLPHWDCDKYYQCADGVAVPRPCPEKLHFNFVTDTCDYPENVKCYRGSNADVEPSVVDVPSVSAVLAEHKCRVFEILGVQRDVLFAHWDCDKYYICDNGAAVTLPCPAGLHFNSFTDTCDYPHNVICFRSSSVEKGAETIAKIAGPSTVYTDLANTKCHIVDLLNWKKDVLLPHWDCDKYYQCADGVAVPRPCPEKLHFNFVTDTCDYPENVKCYRGSNADVEPSVVDVPSVSAVLAEHKCRVFEILGVQRDVLFAHWDCDKYYICDNGAAVTLPCPAGLHFNSFTDTCDYPHNVICFRSSSVEKGAETIAKIAGPSTVYTDLANTKCHIVDLLNWKKDVLLPHWDCDKFYQCADGVAVPRPCPEKLHFNFVTDTCDYPENVKCYRGSNADVEPSVVDVPSVSAVLAEHKCRVFEILGVQRDVLFAHWDCDKYYICDNGAAVTLPCPAGLHFNSFTDTCDYPHNVICFRSSSVEKGAETIAKIAGPSTVYTDLANTKCHIVDLLNWKKDVLLPHWDCDKFYQCADGVAVPRPCPEKLHFNFVTDTCDYPENVKCYRGSDADVEPSVVDVPSVSAVLAEHKCRVFEILGVQRDVLFAHWDCDKYYICDNGAAVTLPCPAGLHFNSFTDKCDYPQNVKCFRSNPVDKNTETVAKIGGPSIINLLNSKSDNTMVEVINDVQIEFFENGCPVSYDIYWLLSHDSDCNIFYQCNFGEKIEIKCPDGLLFNPSLQVCDYPASSGCVYFRSMNKHNLRQN